MRTHFLHVLSWNLYVVHLLRLVRPGRFHDRVNARPPVVVHRLVQRRSPAGVDHVRLRALLQEPDDDVLVPPSLSIVSRDFAATEPRLLRAAVAAFLDLLNLASRALEKFGPVPTELPPVEGETA